MLDTFRKMWYATANALDKSYDKYTDSLVTMPFMHKQFHAGQCFSARGHLIVPSGSTYTIHFTTPIADNYGVIHLQEFDVECNKPEVKVECKEGVTIDTQGSSLFDTFNRNRQHFSDKECGFTIYGDGAISGGEVLEQFTFINQDNKTPLIGNDNLNNLEWILKEQTNCAVDITNNNVDDADLEIFMFWYQLES